MSEKRLITDGKMGMYEYIIVVNQIVGEYFDEDGVYQPHIGELNAMRLFYNFCVKEAPYKEALPCPIENADDMVSIVDDANFVKAFYDETSNEFNSCLSFGKAYRTAMDMVRIETSGANYLVNKIQLLLNELIKNISSNVTDKNIERLADIANGLKNGEISADKLINEYKNSQNFQKLINGKRVGKSRNYSRKKK